MKKISNTTLFIVTLILMIPVMTAMLATSSQTPTVHDWGVSLLLVLIAVIGMLIVVPIFAAWSMWVSTRGGTREDLLRRDAMKRRILGGKDDQQ